MHTSHPPRHWNYHTLPACIACITVRTLVTQITDVQSICHAASRASVACLRRIDARILSLLKSTTHSTPTSLRIQTSLRQHWTLSVFALTCRQSNNVGSIVGKFSLDISHFSAITIDDVSMYRTIWSCVRCHKVVSMK